MRALMVVPAALLLVACASMFGGGSSGKSQCAGSQRTCLTAPQCTWDPANACEMCHCGAPTAPEDYTPQGPPRMQ